MVNPVAGDDGREPRPDGDRRLPVADELADGVDSGAAGCGTAAARRPPGRTERPRRPWPPDEGAGEGIVRLDGWATAVFAAVSVVAVVVPDPVEYVAVPVDLVLFVAGCATFLWAYAVAIGRSRYEALTMAGVFFLADRVAPARVTRALRLLLAVQVVAAVAAAAARPFTAVAFAVLVPMVGLGLMALWGARYGRFPAKRDAGDGA